MSSAEAEFERELRAFDRDVSLFAQYFYAYQATHYLASKDDRLLAAMNWQALYWNTSLGALQEAAFSTLGRIFDKDRRSHSVSRLLTLAQENEAIFSRDAIRARKLEGSKEDPEWLEEYVLQCHEPTAGDWARLNRHLDKWSGVFTAKYQPLRHKVYAHRDRLEEAELESLFSGANYRDLEKMSAFLSALNDVFWQLYHNGRKPVIRLRRHSLVEMIERPGAAKSSGTTGERVALETKAALIRYKQRRG